MSELPEAGEITVRPATSLDSDLLLTWANDPTTRAASFRTEQIEAPAHDRWLADRLASSSTRLLIGYEGPRPIGHIRFERQADGAVEIGLSVARDARGRGVGGSLLRAGLQAARRDTGLAPRRFVARVRVDNDASARLFQGAGFRLRERNESHGVPCFVLELDA